MARRVLGSIAFLIALCWGAVASSTSVDVPGLGTVVGRLGTQGGAHFKGIPYAQPPVADLRWRPPVDWINPFPDGTWDARAYGPVCVQPPSTEFPVARQSEDCLTINIFTPSTAFSTSSSPVLVFVHGGAFIIGSSSSGVLDGSRLAVDYGVVVVTLNYRLGPFGCLALNELLTEEGNLLNYGLLDQQSALRWVQHHIAAFGGNPTRVMLFGESAGGLSVAMHMVIPQSTGLFGAALVESGYVLAKAYDEATYQGLLFSSSLNCTMPSETVDLDCLRSAPARQVMDALSHEILSLQKGTKWGPCVDGTVIPEDPRSLYQKGKIARVPFVMGTNADEGTLFVYSAYNRALSAERYKKIVKDLVDGEEVWQERVLEVYPPTTGDNRVPLSKAFGDYKFVCSTRRAVRASAVHVPTYLYRFTAVPSCSSQTPGPLGSFHSCELGFVFNTPDSYGCTFTPDETILSNNMGQYWTTLATTHKLNPPGLVPWPRYEGDRDENIVFATSGVSIQTHLSQTECDLWDDIERFRTDESSADDVALGGSDVPRVVFLVGSVLLGGLLLTALAVWFLSRHSVMRRDSSDLGDLGDLGDLCSQGSSQD